METITAEPEAKPRNRAWFRFGLRGLLAGVFVLSLLFGGLNRANRSVNERDALISQLKSERVYVNHAPPSFLTLFLMKVHSTDSRSIEKRYIRWISPGWFSSPAGFNAGMLPDEKVQPLVARLQRLGPVNEVLFRGGTLAGLRLFYIGDVPYRQLGPERAGCLIRSHPATSPSSP